MRQRHQSLLCLMVLVLAVTTFASPLSARLRPGFGHVTPHRGVRRPWGPTLKNFVRVDMLRTTAAPGLSAAIPVQFGPVRLVREEQKTRYENFYIPESFFDTCEIQERSGYYVATEKGSSTPVHLYELTFPLSTKPIIKAVIRGANSMAYSDCDLDNALDVLAIAAWGPQGQDLTSVLRIPVRSSATATISKGYGLICNQGFQSTDDTQFIISNCDNALGLYLDGMGLDGGGSDYDGAVQGMFDGDLGGCAPFAGRLNFVPASVLRNNAKEAIVGGAFSIDYTDVVTGPDSMAKNHYRLDYHPRAEKSGFQTISCFSEPTMASQTGTYASSMTIFLTSLTVFDTNLAALALRREIVRATRTDWMIHGCTDPTVVPAQNQAFFKESLLRSTVPLWEYLAIDNALFGLEGFDAYNDVSPIIKERLSDDFTKVRNMLVNPSSRKTKDLNIPDCHVASYPIFADDYPDHRYAATVFNSWNQWNHRHPTKAIDSLARTIAAGYTRDTRTTTPTAAVHAYFGVQGTHLTTSYGVTPAQFKRRFTDLQWLAHCVKPLPPATGATAPTTATSLTPLIFPLAHLADDLAGKRLLEFVRGYQRPGAPPTSPSTAIISIDWSGWQTTAFDNNEFLFAGTEDLAAEVDGFLKKYLQPSRFKQMLGGGVYLSAAYSYVTTWAGKSDSVLESCLTSSSTTSSYEAMRYYHIQTMKTFSSLTDRLKAALKKPESSKITITKAPSKPDIFTEVASSVARTSTVTDTPGVLLAAIVETAHDYIDHVRYKLVANEHNPRSKATKNKFLAEFRKKFLMKPRDVPIHYIKKYLTTREFTREHFMRLLYQAGTLFERPIKMYPTRTNTATAAVPWQPTI